MRGMGSYILKRLLMLVPVLLGVTFLTFMLLNVLPGGSVLAILGTRATGGTVAALSKQLGLNHPALYRYVLWLWQALHGNLGQSFLSRQPVTGVILQRFPVSFELVVLAMTIGLATALPTAILSARRPLGVLDWIFRGFGMLSLSTPAFVFALYMVIIFSVKIHLLPVTGFVPLSQSIPENLRSMALPAITMAAGLYGSYTRILRADMIDQLNSEDYVLTARAKGMTERNVLIRHVFKNSLISLITIVGAQLGTLIGGAAVVETLFGIPGVGQLLLSSINNIDTPVVIGTVVFIATTIVVMNLLTDLAYTLIDPRVKYGSANN